MCASKLPKYHIRTYAIRTAKLYKGPFPSLISVINEREKKKKEEEELSEKEKKKKKNKHNPKRQSFFCIGISKIWMGKNSIPSLLKKLRDKYNLKWLRISMSYHRFTNLKEIFQGDMTKNYLQMLNQKTLRIANVIVSNAPALLTATVFTDHFVEDKW